MAITSTEFYRNIKNKPDILSAEYQAFFDAEWHKIEYGVTINGIYIPGWLYWHTNHWKIQIDTPDGKRPFDNPNLRDNEWLIGENIHRAETEKKGLMIFGSRRLGKELLNSSKLYQVDGEIKIGNAKVGDEIYGADGKLTKIIGVFPQGKKRIYRISLLDGRKLYAGLDHQWLVFDQSKQEEIVITTEQMLATLNNLKVSNKNKETRYFIPNNKHVQYNKKEQPIPPYLLGTHFANGKDKRIPKDYLYSSYEQRLELLKGLMDIKGSCYKNGTLKFITASKELGTDFYFLCRSLGINLTKKTKTKGKTVYYFILFTKIPIFKSKRKLSLMSLANKLKQDKIEKTAILDIEYVYNDLATCIAVENKDHLYLTDNFTVTHNSEFAASYIGRSATIYSGTENVISGGNEKDIKLITSKCDKGLNQLHPEFQFGRIENNWGKQVTLGYKDKQGNRNPWSEILIRNFEDGAKTEAAAGTTPKSFIMDECGKYPFLPCFEAAKPGFVTPFGWRCCPILLGTGGTFKYGDSAQEIFTHPENYNFVAIEVPEEKRYVGMFIPGKCSLEVPKTEIPLEAYLNKPVTAKYKDIKIWVTPDDAQEYIEKNVYGPALKSNDPTAYPKARMYYPTTVDDCFMSDTGNEFPIEEAKAHLKFLDVNNITGQYVWLKRKTETGKIFHTYASKGEVPVTEFPVKPDTDKNAPFVIWEFPVSNPPYNLYVAGADPYNQNKSVFSTSLGTVYIYKRMTDITGEVYQDRVVASYAARPKTMAEWHENVEMLLEYYQAICFPENEAGTFIQYFENKNKLHLLADGLDWLKEHNPTSSTRSRVKGAAATVKNIGFMMATMLDYCKEEIQVGIDDEGKPIKKLGLVRIPDKLLLKEIINYREGGNFDRIVAFRHALAYSKHLDKHSPIIALSPIKEDHSKKAELHSPFALSHSSPFGSLGSPFIGRYKPH